MIRAVRTLAAFGLTMGIGLIHCSASALTPMETVRESTRKVLDVLADPALEGSEKAEQRREKIRAIIDEDFDWPAMCRRALGRHWRGKTEKQQKEFIELFGELLERRYMDKIDNYSGQEVDYENERVDEEDGYAQVDVGIITEDDKEISVQYRMHREGDEWLVYDVVVEGVSLVMNYRSQFNSILARSTFDELIETLRKKVE